MNTLTSIITEARAHYVSKYRTATIDYLARFQPSHAEVMVDRHTSPSPIPYRYYRFDLAAGAESPANFTEVNVDPHVLFVPFIVVHRNEMRIEVHPLVWNGIEVRVEPIPGDVDPFTAWVWRWLDDGDTKPQDDVGFSGVIHSVTAPSIDGSAWCTSVDFGTAPIEAFEDMVRTLCGMRAASIRISSFWATKDQ